MGTKIARLLKALTLIGIGAVLVFFFTSGRLEQYLHPLFRPGVLVAGILFVAGGLIYAFAESSANCCVDDECLHQGAGTPLQGLLAFGFLIVPLVAGSMFSKDAFDKTAISNRGFVQDVTKLPRRKPTVPTAPSPIPSQALGGDIDAAASAPVQTATSGPSLFAKASAETPNQANINQPAGPTYEPPLPQADQGGTATADAPDYLPKGPDGNISLQVSDLLYGEAEESIRKAFTGKKVEILGQYLPGKSATEFKLVRMFIVCCAADARPIALPVSVSKEYHGNDMGWVTVIGTPDYKVNAANGSATVTLRAEQILPSDPPEDAMLY
jgi:uncharacterized repeat protein (TIGR03943 family)